MRRAQGRKSSLADIATRQPEVGERFSVVILGGTALYARDGKWLAGAIQRIQGVIEDVLRENLLVARNHLEKLVRERLEEDLNDRVLGAVLGRSLRMGRTAVFPCLTVYGRIFRMYFSTSSIELLNSKLELLEDLLREKAAVSVAAAQSACFPELEWGTQFISKQMLAHLAYVGRAVFVDQDLFTSPLPSLRDAFGNPRK